MSTEMPINKLQKQNSNITIYGKQHKRLHLQVVDDFSGFGRNALYNLVGKEPKSFSILSYSEPIICTTAFSPAAVVPTRV